VNGIANLVERDVVNFHRGSSQRRLTSTRRAIVPKGKDRSRGHVRSRCPDGVNRVIHAPVTSDLPLEQTFSVGGRHVSKVPKADIR
jgi:hypothetical protein